MHVELLTDLWAACMVTLIPGSCKIHMYFTTPWFISWKHLTKFLQDQWNSIGKKRDIRNSLLSPPVGPAPTPLYNNHCTEGTTRLTNRYSIFRGSEKINYTSVARCLVASKSKKYLRCVGSRLDLSHWQHWTKAEHHRREMQSVTKRQGTDELSTARSLSPGQQTPKYRQGQIVEHCQNTSWYLVRKSIIATILWIQQSLKMYNSCSQASKFKCIHNLASTQWAIVIDTYTDAHHIDLHALYIHVHTDLHNTVHHREPSVQPT